MSTHTPPDKALPIPIIHDRRLPATMLGSLGLKPKMFTDAHCLGGHTSSVNSARFSPDGQLALTGSTDKTAILWHVDTGRIVRRLEGHWESINSVGFSPDGRLALTGSSDKAAILWDVAGGRIVRRLQGHSDSVRSCCFSPDGRLALTGSADNTAIIWDVGEGAIRRRFTGHTNDVPCAGFSPDGRLAITGSLDGMIIFRDAETGEPLCFLHNLKSGFLWMTPPARNAPCGWLHTDREDLISVFRAGEDGDRVEILADSDPDRRLYLGIYNRRDMVMNQIHDRVKAKEQEVKISGYIDANVLQTRVSILRTRQRLIEGGETCSGDVPP